MTHFLFFFSTIQLSVGQIRELSMRIVA